MWIIFSILAILAIIIAIILLLPVKVIIKNDENNALILRYKLLFKTFGENPNPDDPIVKALLKAGGVDRLKKSNIQQNVKAEGLQQTVSDSYSALVELLKELVYLLKHCTIAKLTVQIHAADEDPSEAAVYYGIYTAATYTLLSALNSFLRIRKKNVNLDIRCVYHNAPALFRYHVVLTVPTYRVLAAFWRAVMEEVKRSAQHQAK